MFTRQTSVLLRAVCCLCLAAILASATHAQTRRALLIGIDHYAPPAGASLSVPASGHSLDSRFASGSSWIDLNGPSIDVASMKVLLEQTYQFSDIRVLPEEQATRRGILEAIEKLADDAESNDLIVFYFAGHGSQRRDTLSSKNQLDETIVPIDAWKGARDIRDKELALLFNRIVYEKHARLTAIYDSCHSGTMARGITSSVQRTLAYDDRDVAEDKKRDPSTVTEVDLKQIPQKGNAIIIAAAASTESAVEAKYPDDGQFHGAFTRALVRVLQSSTQTLSAVDAIAEASSMMHADHIPFQQPSVEGRVQESLFGAPVSARSLHVRVAKVAGATLTLDVGSAGGFDVGTQFSALEAASDGQKTVIEVKNVNEPLVSTAQVVSGPPSVKFGEIFELSKMTYPKTARLVIFASKPEPIPTEAGIDKIHALFSGLSWLDDPTVAPIDFLVVAGPNGWIAFNQNGREFAPGAKAKGNAFLLLGPPPSLIEEILKSPPFQRNAFSFTQNLADANYLLAMRLGSGRTPEYALIDPVVLAQHKPESYVRSPENDPDDTTLNKGILPDVVCRNDVSLPVRTAWLADTTKTGTEIVLALNRRIVRLGKLRIWLQSPALAPGSGGWPYHLAVTQPNSDEPIGGTPLAPAQLYEVKLLATADQIASVTPIPKYIYLFGFDCAANPFLLYPIESMNGDATFPQPGPDGIYPKSIKLLDQGVGTPVGADTLFFMATKEKITDLSLLTSDGVLERKPRGATVGRFDELISDMSDAATRGPVSVPTNWLVQQLVIPSRP